MDYALCGGVHNPDDVVKAILAGASAVEVCSVLYHQGGDWIKTATERLQQWQEKHAYRAIEEYKGKMNAKHQEGEDRFNRTQFLKYFESFKK